MNIQYRPAVKAGSWYSDSYDILSSQISQMLANASCYKSKHVIGGIVPHAGLAFSGPIAAQTFKSLQHSMPDIETLILLGAVHTMLLDTPAVWSDGVWECPLGNIDIDNATAKKIVAHTCAQDFPQPHIDDNALELQLPFIKHCFSTAEIVPVAVPCNSTAAKFGSELGAILKDSILAGKTAFLASTDLTHYGQAYGFAPAGMGKDCLNWAKENDNRLLDLVKSLNADSIATTAQNDHSACGGGAVAAACALATCCQCSEGIILEHTNSYEIMPQPEIDLFVGYCSAVFVK